MAYGIHSEVATDQFGNALTNASVTVYLVVAGVVQVNPLATIYTPASSITATPFQQSNPMTTDALGRYAFGAPDGFYAIDISGSNFATYRIYKNLVTTFLPGAGGVASVSIAAPIQFTISGSPVVNTGTLTLSWATQNNNLFLVGPATGGPLVPTFRALVTADLPASGVGAAAYQSLNTGTGALVLTTFTVDATGRVTLAANTATTIPVFAGQGTWTKSQNVASVSPVFGSPMNIDATLGNAFHFTATSNFTFNLPTGMVSGGTYLFRIQQDGTGSRIITFSGNWKWPSGTPGVLSTAINAIDLLTGYFDGTSLLCTLQRAYA